MPKYLVQASYTVEGVKGFLKDGGSKRRAAVAQTVKSFGGKLETFYYAFGDTDVFVIVDAPDNVTLAAVSLAINAAGGVQTKTTVLLTPDEMDQAIKKEIKYQPPGA